MSVRKIAIALSLVFSSPFALHAQQVDPGLFSELRWRAIGPMRASRNRAGSGVASQPYTFYTGAVNGGVWKTTDAGRTWIPIFDDQPTQSIGVIGVAPSDANVIYVGSGEGLHRPDLSVGNGLYKSTDAGKSWTQLGLRDAQQIAGMSIDPANPDRLFVAVMGHPYGPNTERGVYRSTDGGRTLERVLYKDENVGANDVDIDPSNPSVVYANLWEARQGPWENSAWAGTGGGLFKSVDGGSTWTMLSGGLPPGVNQVNLSIAPSNSRRLYAVVSTVSGGGVGLYRSDDAGGSWTRITEDTRPTGRIGGGDLPVPIVNPKNPDMLIMASTVSWKSMDGGKTWAPFKGAPGGEDYQGGWINPNDPNIILMIADQGAVVSLNGGESWSSWYNQPTAAMYHVTADNAFPYRLCSGQQESGSACVSSRGNYGVVSDREWLPVGVDEYGYVAPDPLNPDLVYGGRSVTRFDRRTGLTSTVGPLAGRGGGGGRGGPAPTGPQVRNVRTQPVVFSLADPHALYYGGGFLWKTVDGGNSWKQISPNFTRPKWDPSSSVGKFLDQARSQTPQLAAIYAIGPSPIETGRIWFGTDDGLIMMTKDGGAHWADVTPPSVQPFWKVFTIDAGHFDANTAYAAVNTLRVDDMKPHIYRTHDAGKTWTEIVTGMGAAGPANAVREDPRKKGLLYSSTERGVYVSFDDGDHWQSLRNNLPATSVRDLIVKDDDIAVGTHGRGFWILDDITALRQMDAAALGADAFLFKPTTAWRVRPNTSSDMPWPKEEATMENPPDGVPIDYHLKSAANGPLLLEILTTDGRVVRRFSSDDPITPIPEASAAPVPLYWYRQPRRLATTAGLHRFIWDVHLQPAGGGGGGGRGGLPINSVPGKGAAAPTGPWANPGTYTVRLTVSGRSYTQPITVKQDPRATTPAPVLAEAYGMTRDMYYGALDAQAALVGLGAIRSQLATIKSTATGAALQATSAFDTKAASLQGQATTAAAAPAGRGGRGGAPGGAAAEPGSLSAVAATAAALSTSLQAADVGPTANQRQAIQAARVDLAAAMLRWTTLKRELGALNVRLKAAGLAEVKP